MKTNYRILAIGGLVICWLMWTIQPVEGQCFSRRSFCFRPLFLNSNSRIDSHSFYPRIFRPAQCKGQHSFLVDGCDHLRFQCYHGCSFQIPGDRCAVVVSFPDFGLQSCRSNCEYYWSDDLNEYFIIKNCIDRGCKCITEITVDSKKHAPEDSQEQESADLIGEPLNDESLVENLRLSNRGFRDSRDRDPVLGNCERVGSTPNRYELEISFDSDSPSPTLVGVRFVDPDNLVNGTTKRMFVVIDGEQLWEVELRFSQQPQRPDIVSIEKPIGVVEASILVRFENNRTIKVTHYDANQSNTRKFRFGHFEVTSTRKF